VQQSEIYSFGFAAFYSEIEEHENAIKYYEKAISLNIQNYDALNNLGTLYLKLKDMTKAEEKFKAAIVLDAGRPESYYNLAEVYVSNGLQAEALESIYLSIEKDEMYSYSYSRAGNILSKMYYDDEAEKYYKIALDLDPSNASAWLGLGNIIIANIMMIFNGSSIRKLKLNYEIYLDVLDLLDYYDQYLSLNAADTGYYSNLGILYHLIGLFNLSMDNFDRAFELDKQIGKNETIYNMMTNNCKILFNRSKFEYLQQYYHKNFDTEE
jgi:tetratricopeptide (TPR) repeat protein